MWSYLKKTAGFTLTELMVASSIFAICMVVISTSGINFYNGYQRQQFRDALFEETRVLMDRIAREIKINTIDFDEYYNQLPPAQGGPPTSGNTFTITGEPNLGYGQIYRQYHHQFFFVNPPSEGGSDCENYGANNPQRYNFVGTDPCHDQHVDEGFFSTGANDITIDDNPSVSALYNPSGIKNEQTELYLISEDGKTKTILKRIGNNIDDDFDDAIDEADNAGVAGSDTAQEQLGILVLELQDLYDNSVFDTGELPETPDGPDNYYDSWRLHVDFDTPDGGETDFPFLPISPPSIEITELKFFVSPIEDPYKAFNEDDVEIQVHPNVTVILTAQVSQDTLLRFPTDSPPSVTLQTTVSSRIYDNVDIPFSTL